MTVKIAKKVLATEAKAIEALRERLDGDFNEIVSTLYECRGKVIVAGLGKSGIIGSKLAASLSSTGTPSFFLHAGEAGHGGLGILSSDDVLVALSYSGESADLQNVITRAKRLNIKIIAITGSTDSTLARSGDIVFNAKVKSEASITIPFLPTTSTTVMLALCDAITVALLERKGFYEKDFAEIHPGGAIGKRFKIINDLMHKGDEVPLVDKDAELYEVMKEITQKNFGLTGVLEDGELTGVITDADIRRYFIKKPVIEGVKACEIMTRNPKVICRGETATRALAFFEKFTITSLFVVEKKNRKKVVGYIHLKDLMRAKVM